MGDYRTSTIADKTIREDSSCRCQNALSPPQPQKKWICHVQCRKLRDQFNSADLLVIDDLFLRKLPPNAGDELADVLMSRYEKFSVVITSNRAFDDWAMSSS